VSETVTVELELESELFQWFEEYCRDGLLEIDEELVAVAEQFMREQIDDAVDSGKVVLGVEKEESENFDDYDDEDEES
jgi:hypothetical protein